MDTYLAKTLFIDVEADRGGRLNAVGAVLDDRIFRWEKRGSRSFASAGLDGFVRGAERIAGHNILAHDLPILRDALPGLAAWTLPVVDTLVLSPLAFPANPYHRLIKGYKLEKDAVNDPVADARLCRAVLRDEIDAFVRLVRQTPDAAAFHRFALSGPGHSGMADLFGLCGAPLPPTAFAAFTLWMQCATARVCTAASARLAAAELEPSVARLAFAHALAWLGVAGGASVLPAWVRHQHPAVRALLHNLRDTPCDAPSCAWCRTAFSATHWLRETFGFDVFRPKPAAPDGGSLQQRIVEAGLAGRPALAVLPTGGGKSLCFQVPALARHQRTGALTVVVSPLQALMKDQVDNFRSKTGRPAAAAALYGALTLPERGAVMDRVRQGDVALLYVSPEQLRNPSVVRTIEQREIGAWVFDEAHCLSKWGHDFRPDYLYTARFIAELAERQGTPPPPVTCLTATAKHEVVEEIRSHIRDRLGQELDLYAGGAERSNLTFTVESITPAEKVERIAALLEQHVRQGGASACAVVYAATRRGTQDLRDALAGYGWPAAAFHAGMKAADKAEVLAGFIGGSIPVVCATNAFGMGIDKDSVRLVVHADVPGSLEAYTQEAGRAGRDGLPATCVLLFDPDDLEDQFRLAARSELRRRDIGQILRGVRRLSQRLGKDEVVATAGELVADPELDLGFAADDSDADTKVKTALSWLERAGLVIRSENRTSVITARPKPLSLEQARTAIGRLGLPAATVAQWMAIFRTLVAVAADPSEEHPLTVDTLAALDPLAADTAGPPQEATAKVLTVLTAMAGHGLIESGTVLTAQVRPSGVNASRRVLAQFSAAARTLLATLREEAPDGEELCLSLTAATQRLRDRGCAECQPEVVLRLLKTLSDTNRQGSARLRLATVARWRYSLKLSGTWQGLEDSLRRQEAVASLVLDRLLATGRAADGAGKTVVPFAIEELAQAVTGDLTLATEVSDPVAAVQAALLMLHDWKVILLQGGLSVFRQGLSLRLPEAARGRRYTNDDHEPLARHYAGRTFQIHAMGEYARLGLTSPERAAAFAADYFALPEDRLLARHFPGRRAELARPVSADSYARIVTDLANPAQQAIVTAPVGRNLLVLAGPGSGKTRVIVHRCAYLLRVLRVPAQAILVLCYNHAAALSIRRRLRALIGDEAGWIDAYTYHALAMRLVGASIAERLEHRPDSAPADPFSGVIGDATALLRGESAFPGLDAEDVRERLLARYRYILIDEYQDIDEEQYDLVSAIAGRQEKDAEARIALMAVGDDDQAVYGFRHADVAFIRRYQADYAAEVHHLVENYRSTAAVIAASNTLIRHNTDRMKTEHPIRIDRARAEAPAGEPVRVLEVGTIAHQIGTALDVIERRRARHSGTSWSDFAVLARQRHVLAPFHALCDHAGIPCDPAYDTTSDRFPLHRLREVVTFLDRLKRATARVDGAWLQAQLAALRQEMGASPWWTLVEQLLGGWATTSAGRAAEPEAVREALYEGLSQLRRERSTGAGIHIGTLHGAKGLEFRHVILLDGGWDGRSSDRAPAESNEEERRLFYVGMTRARETLCLMRRADVRNPHLPLLDGVGRVACADTGRADHGVLRRQRTVLGLGDLHIDFAGRQPATAPVHRVMAALRPGDAVTLRAARSPTDRVSVLSADGTVIARLSEAASRHWSYLISAVEQVRMHAVVRRHRKDCTEAWRGQLKTESWELPVIEVWTHSVR
ncbi:RecQ family ATP-dependent DNA helicase [Azospirillum rugosum]|uniref:DNA 3'-5' helicase n=1 Tax=Azospirillum rugosum TaxID=416170 RepID=A0ABS4SWE6_9PROT|nr:RecQ family ATP-dependent DNA helicase [Azospirillum rugosum]MBP2296889.1 ATP-dependent DNA helicase RecQ [Azospirillum rugosum]MDQ0530527.1 ATP-dependent DNA helicase RecQ [Azospirillum rugosum]